MHAHQGRLVRGDLAQAEGQMRAAADRIEIGMHIEFAVAGLEAVARRAGHGMFVRQPVMDQVGDGADLELVRTGELFEVAAARHAAVLVHDFDDDRRRGIARQPRQIAAGFGMPRPPQDAAGLGNDRKDMARLNDVLRTRIGACRNLDRARPVGGGNARGNAARGFDGNREAGLVPGAVVVDHQRQLEKLAALPGQGQADQAAGVFRHEIDVFRAHALRREHEVAFVLAFLVVHYDDHFALADVVDQFRRRIQFHLLVCFRSGPVWSGPPCCNRSI